MPRYDCIIWDWNGTLLDDTWLCLDVMNPILEARGLELVTMARYRSIFDFPVEKYYQRLGFNEQTDPFLEVSHEFIDNYNARRHECRLFEGVEEMLSNLRTNGQRMALLSAYKHDTLLSIIKHFGLGEHFEQLSGNSDIYARGKAERAGQLLEGLGVNSTNALFIGDTLHDYEVAQQIGARCLLVSHGYHSAERLEATGAPLVHTIEEIYNFIV